MEEATQNGAGISWFASDGGNATPRLLARNSFIFHLGRISNRACASMAIEIASDRLTVSRSYVRLGMAVNKPDRRKPRA
jgi:hypothetical protein